jgi:hypothetical protein
MPGSRWSLLPRSRAGGWYNAEYHPVGGFAEQDRRSERACSASAVQGHKQCLGAFTRHGEISLTETSR